MKKLLIPFLFLFTFFSCNREDLQPSIKNETTVIEEQSEIALIEKEIGISFFKKDITLIDESGKNEVVMRIASKEEEVLREYLELYNLSISPVYAKDYEKVEPSQTLSTESENDYQEELAQPNIDGILSELISQKLDKDVIGVNIHVKLNILENGRVTGNGFPYDVTYYSGTWPEEFECTSYGSIGYKLMGKSRWYSGWSTRTFCSMYYPNPCQSYWRESGQHQRLWIDGPYKVRVTFDYYSVSDFSFRFINY